MILGAPPPTTLFLYACVIMCTGNASVISDRDSGESPSAPVLWTNRLRQSSLIDTPADLLHAGDFLLLNLLAYIPSLLLALNIVSSVWNPVSQHSCRPPISENTPLISSLFLLCSTPFTAQQTCFLWPGPARIPPHHIHLHFLCLISDRAVSWDICHHITFFSHADGFMFGGAAH